MFKEYVWKSTFTVILENFIRFGYIFLKNSEYYIETTTSDFFKANFSR